MQLLLRGEKLGGCYGIILGIELVYSLTYKLDIDLLWTTWYLGLFAVTDNQEGQITYTCIPLYQYSNVIKVLIILSNGEGLIIPHTESRLNNKFKQRMDSNTQSCRQINSPLPPGKHKYNTFNLAKYMV